MVVGSITSLGLWCLIGRGSLIVSTTALLLWTTNKRKSLNKYPVFASLRAVLGFPLVKIKPAFHQNSLTFPHVLIDCLPLLAISTTVDKTYLLVLLPSWPRHL